MTKVSHDITETKVIELLKDCTDASIALSEWFSSQLISPPEAVIVMGILMTGLVETSSKLTDKKIDRILRQVRILVRAVHAGQQRKRSRCSD
jgi:hypothetical protein